MLVLVCDHSHGQGRPAPQTPNQNEVAKEKLLTEFARQALSDVAKPNNGTGFSMSQS